MSGAASVTLGCNHTSTPFSDLARKIAFPEKVLGYEVTVGRAGRGYD